MEDGRTAGVTLFPTPAPIHSPAVSSSPLLPLLEQHFKDADLLVDASGIFVPFLYHVLIAGA